MGLRMRNYNNFEILWKLWFLRGRGVHKNKNIEGALPKKGGGLGEFADLRVGLGKKERCSVFEGGGWLISQCTIWYFAIVQIKLDKVFTYFLLILIHLFGNIISKWIITKYFGMLNGFIRTDMVKLYLHQIIKSLFTAFCKVSLIILLTYKWSNIQISMEMSD